MTGETANISGAAVIKALEQARVAFIVALPDIVTSANLLWPIERHRDFHLVRVCKEDEGVSICAGLAACDQRAVLLMQQTGLMDSLNAVRAIALDYALPICMLVGLQGKEAHLKPRQSAARGVRIIEPILDVMGLARDLIEEPEDCRRIAPAIDEAYRTSTPRCLLIGRSPGP